MSFTIPYECFMDWSVNWRKIIVGFTSPMPSLLKIDKGIRLILTLRLNGAFPNVRFPIVHGMWKLPRSLSSGGSFFWIMELYFLTINPSWTWCMKAFAQVLQQKKKGYQCVASWTPPEIWQIASLPLLKPLRKWELCNKRGVNRLVPIHFLLLFPTPRISFA